MTLLDAELRKLTPERLASLATDCENSDVRDAARAVLAEWTADAVGGEEFLRRTFPPHPDPFA